MKKPNVAVIITNYNYGAYVISAISSAAYKQDYAGDIRVYIVDDGSSDDSWIKYQISQTKLRRGN